MTFRFSAQVACGLLALSVGLAACSQADCAALAICTVPINQSSEDAGAAAQEEATALGPHCAGMGRACAGDDCCASVLVPGGTFKRGFDGVPGGEYTDPSFLATLSDFRLDVYEVTMGRFRAFLADYPRSLPMAGAGRNPNDPTDPGWEPSWNAEMPQTAAALNKELHCGIRKEWRDAPAGDETKPMPCLTWYEAFAFCIWDGGRLPTEAEWNYAAAGGSEQRAYPWSSPSKSLALDESHAVFQLKTGGLSPVGSKPNGAGRWGHADLAGNAAEWSADWWRDSYRINPCDDCGEHVPGDAPMRTLHGGDSTSPPMMLRAARRDGATPTIRRSNWGARCAR